MTNVLLCANLVALLGIGGWLYVLQRRAATLRASVDWLAADAAALPSDLRTEAREAGVSASPFYTIEILNPLEVAAAESKLGEMFAGLTPGIVRREVYRRAHGIIVEQLTVRGIRADVKLHG